MIADTNGRYRWTTTRGPLVPLAAWAGGTVVAGWLYWRLSRDMVLHGSAVLPIAAVALYVPLAFLQYRSLRTHQRRRASLCLVLLIGLCAFLAVLLAGRAILEAHALKTTGGATKEMIEEAAIREVPQEWRQQWFREWADRARSDRASYLVVVILLALLYLLTYRAYRGMPVVP